MKKLSFCLYVQTHISRDVLRHQYAERLQREPHMSGFRKASINNVIPDSVVPEGYSLGNME